VTENTGEAKVTREARIAISALYTDTSPDRDPSSKAKARATGKGGNVLKPLPSLSMLR
jgi:hypothetical protein